MQSKDENRYAVCKAAMALFARHAALFRPVLLFSLISLVLRFVSR
jgi:hypothetical protein